MSKIALASNPSGTGTFTLASPATNTDRTLTLPDVTTTLVGTDATQTLTNKTIASSQLTGALPAIDGSALTNLPSSAPTTAQVGTATAGLAAGAVGSYAWLTRSTSSATTFSFGTTYAGSDLLPYGYNSAATTYGQTVTTGGAGAAQSGTWRAMGTVSNGQTDFKHTLFLRIS
jgi:hypothetical protein